jgi:hypothetical protein
MSIVRRDAAVELAITEAAGAEALAGVDKATGDTPVPGTPAVPQPAA